VTEPFPSNARVDKEAKPVYTRTTKTVKETVAPAEEPKKVESVVTGKVVRRKQPIGKRFFQTFFGGDAKSVAGFVMMDVLLPSAKDMIFEAFTQGMQRTLFGESGPGATRRPGASRPGYTPYNRMGAGTRPAEPREISRAARSQHNFDEILLATRVEAETVIDRLYDLIERYEEASVADLYDLVEISGDFTDAKWGWKSLTGARAVRTRDGYLLDLPRPENLS
jgi:hypothetical protein